ERATAWNARPESRQLPSLLQWTGIRLLTRKKTWTEPERWLMQQAARYHVRRGLVVAVLLALLAWGGYEGYGTFPAKELQNRLLVADTIEVPSIVKNMDPVRHWVDPMLRQTYQAAEANNDERKRLHASLALLPVDPGQVDYL